MYNSRVNMLSFLFSIIFLSSVFTVLFFEAIEINNSSITFSLDSIFTHKNIFFILVKFSIILAIYLLSIILLLIFLNSNNTVLKKVNFIDDNPKVNNELNLNQIISNELRKSASFDQDIVLALVSSQKNNIKENRSEFFNLLKKQFLFNDLIFKYNDNIFGILLPNVDLEKGIQQIEKFDQLFVSSGSKSLNFPLSFGLSSRNGRLISGSIILKEAKASLNKSMIDKNFPIIGFRPNPAQYREYLFKQKNINHHKE